MKEWLKNVFENDENRKGILAVVITTICGFL